MPQALIKTNDIADNAISNSKIAGGAVDDSKISSVGGNKLIDFSVSPQKMLVGQVANFLRNGGFDEDVVATPMGWTFIGGAGTSISVSGDGRPDPIRAGAPPIGPGYARKLHIDSISPFPPFGSGTEQYLLRQEVNLSSLGFNIANDFLAQGQQDTFRIFLTFRAKVPYPGTANAATALARLSFVENGIVTNFVTASAGNLLTGGWGKASMTVQPAAMSSAITYIARVELGFANFNPIALAADGYFDDIVLFTRNTSA